ncbi:toll/interleukin-1 receptor domain-containing protein [Bradyrhizobium sp. Ec3.3]|uniref:toll/interleukin-1 receptor domain-containing protein n=1 Tax=Bradyrhizobium sp. Ec3.3 TaxID=189753 RepID=UPI000686216F|nr:toll/interleukin-1 receptor domain-containing protein [Bradyrhizobium sp. Ec3.3]
MAMKVFLSHQQQDSTQAVQIASRLKQNGLNVYVDVADRFFDLGSEDLSQHICAEMAQCTQLMAVVSANAALSWWVPWEIGVATEKAHPIASFALDGTSLPDYLKKWPYLRTLADFDVYCAEANRTYDPVVMQKSFITEASARRGVESFHRSLKA